MRKRTVLFIIDDVLSASLIPELVKRKSKGEWEAVCCTTERKFKKVLADGPKLDAVLVDLKLETGFEENGFVIAQELKRKSIPVGIITGYLPHWIARDAKELGIPAFELKIGGKRFGYWEALLETIKQESRINRERSK